MNDKKCLIDEKLFDNYFYLDGSFTLDRGSMGTEKLTIPLQWRHNGRDGVSNHQPHQCLLNRLFGAQIKENIKALRHWPLCGELTGDRWISRTNGQ